jgi:hypothetical protein
VIAASAESVYEFAADIDNLPNWAEGLAKSSVVRRGDLLVVDSPMGEVSVRFVPRNDFGVIDHDVTLPDGTTVTNPGRILSHPEGAEIIFTLRQLALSDAEFEKDAAQVEHDLERLKTLVEKRPAAAT